ncbi:MAG: 4Fe-4S binding protein [Thermincolia bacterium]
MALQEKEKSKYNLLQIPVIKAIFKSKLFPGVFQYLTLIIFGFVIYQLLLGPGNSHDNFGTAMTWIVWWTVIPIIFVLLGRFWCAICPFATVSDLVQKIVGVNGPVPRFLKTYGIWIIDFLFILITWADHVFGIVKSPRGSGILLLMLTTGVIIAGAFFVRRTWCRYLCFLGGLSGNYARAGLVELRATPEICAKCDVKACYNGNEKAPGCPMFEFPRSMDDSARCNLCGHCVKTCPNDSIRISSRTPTSELWFIKRPKVEESFLAIVIMGIVFVQNITMLEIWGKILTWLEHALGITSYSLIFTLTFLIAMALPVAALTLASWLVKLGNGESVKTNFARFGYALIPLDLAGHVAHNLFHLLAEGKAVVFTALAMFGIESHRLSPALAAPETIKILEFVLLGLGAIGSLYGAYRIAKFNDGVKYIRSFLPMAILIVVFTLVNVYLFLLPMAMRM